MGCLGLIASCVLLSLVALALIPHADVTLNRNYQAGRRFEYEVKKIFENQGYKVIRASGSHGLFDLVAIRQDQILLIQCKLCSDGATLARLRSKWLSDPPFKPYKFPATQVLAGKIKGSSEIVYQNI